jgi:stage II sporulation protein D
MDATRGEISLRDWTPDARSEPMVRVGIILDCDAQGNVDLRLPDQRYQVSGLTGGADAEPSVRLAVRYAGDSLVVQIGDRQETGVRGLRLSPVGRALPSPEAGALVRDVITGRGFHWQKRIDLTLAGTLELLPGQRGILLVNEVPLEDYLPGVITGEMSSACPLEFLKAQCVVARSWLLALTEPKHVGEPFDRCNDDCCQRYQGTSGLNPIALAAVRKTFGLVLLNPAGGVLDANYAKSCGGISETPWAVWGLDKPGISPVVDAPPDAPERRFFPVTEQNLDEYLDGAWLAAARCYCSPNVVPVDEIGKYLGRVDTADDYFRWTVRYGRRELEQLLREGLTDARELAELRDLRVRARGASGRAYTMEVEWADAHGAVLNTRVESEYRIRQVLHRKFLYSSAFAVRTDREADGRLAAVTLRGAGWGHGVGLCQIGALGMALSGSDYAAICQHYYPAARLASVYA